MIINTIDKTITFDKPRIIKDMQQEIEVIGGKFDDYKIVILSKDLSDNIIEAEDITVDDPLADDTKKQLMR